MRATIWLTASALALALAACSPKQAAAPSPPPPAPASEPAPPLPAASAPGPESPPGAAKTPETTATMSTPPAPAAAAPAPYRFSPGDFGRQERRIAALIANAETRDALGETAGVAAQGQRARERCTTRKCVEAAYAAEEARLRKWEGSGDIK
jgi:hypothetical protein